MDKKETFNKKIERCVESCTKPDLIVPHDTVEAFHLAQELENIIRQVIPTIVVEKRE